MTLNKCDLKQNVFVNVGATCLWLFLVLQLYFLWLSIVLLVAIAWSKLAVHQHLFLNNILGYFLLNDQINSMIQNGRGMGRKKYIFPIVKAHIHPRSSPEYWNLYWIQPWTRSLHVTITLCCTLQAFFWDNGDTNMFHNDQLNTVTGGYLDEME